MPGLNKMDRFRPNVRRFLSLMGSLTVLVLAIGAPASALTASDQAQTNDRTVTLTVFVTYSSGQCSDGQATRQVTSVTTKFTRTSGSGRKVSTSHLLGLAYGHKCDNSFVQQKKQGSWSPVFGCNGRCGGTETEALGIATSFPAIRSQVGCEICNVGGSGDGHATTSTGSPLAPSPICRSITLSGSGVPCPDLF